MEVERKKYSLLLCEDDVNFGLLLTEFLRTKDFEVDFAHDGEEGWEYFSHGVYDLVLSDIRMPRKNGIDLACDIKESGSDVAIVFLTALNSQEDIVKGYNAGADEYIVKPCSMDVLLCKINAILRRTIKQKSESVPTVFDLDGAVFDYEHRSFVCDDMRFDISSHDAAVLLMLVQAQGETVERSRLLKTIWKSDSHFASRSLNVYITRLRHLLQKSSYTILNVHGKGYKLVHK